MKTLVKIAVVTVVVGVAVYFFVQRRAEALERRRVREVEPTPISVSTVPVRKGEIDQFVYATGTIRAVKREWCYFEESGRVVRVKQVPDQSGSDRTRDLKEGDRVQKGELLAQVDPRTLEQQIKVAVASLNEAEATLAKAKTDLKRNTLLWDRRTISKDQLEQYELEAARAEASLETAKAKLRQAEIDLEHTKIVSPCDGLVAYMNVKVGYYYGSGGKTAETESEALKSVPFVILHDDVMELTADVPAAYTDQIKPGQKTLIFKNIKEIETLDDGKSENERRLIDGEVYSVNPAIDPGGRSVQVKIRSRVPDLTFRDGQYLSCWIITKTANDAMILPFNVLLFQDNQPYCFVAKNGVAERRPLRLGIESRSDLQILSGVEPDEQVVDDGKHRLVDGAPVRVVEKEGANANL